MRGWTAVIERERVVRAVTGVDVDLALKCLELTIHSQRGVLVIIFFAAHPVDDDECSLSTHGCHSQAACYNTRGSYKCHCNEGFEGDGSNCQG